CVAPRAARRPADKARRPRISGIFEGGATQSAGMRRRPNAAGLSPRAVRPARNGGPEGPHYTWVKKALAVIRTSSLDERSALGPDRNEPDGHTDQLLDFLDVVLRGAGKVVEAANGGDIGRPAFHLDVNRCRRPELRHKRKAFDDLSVDRI